MFEKFDYKPKDYAVVLDTYQTHPEAHRRVCKIALIEENTYWLECSLSDRDNIKIHKKDLRPATEMEVLRYFYSLNEVSISDEALIALHKSVCDMYDHLKKNLINYDDDFEDLQCYIQNYFYEGYEYKVPKTP